MKNNSNIFKFKWGMGLSLCTLGMIMLFSFTKNTPLYIDSPEITLSLGNKVIVVETNNWKIRKELALKEVLDVSYSKDGKYLVLGNCSKNNVVTLDADNYCEEAILLSS